MTGDVEITIGQDETGWFYAVDGVIWGDSLTEAEAREGLADALAEPEPWDCGSALGCSPQGCPSCNEDIPYRVRRI